METQQEIKKENHSITDIITLKILELPTLGDNTPTKTKQWLIEQLKIINPWLSLISALQHHFLSK